MTGVGSIDVGFFDDRTIECIARGHLLRAHVEDAQRSIDQHFAARSGALHILFDGARVDGFEPGLPMSWVHWYRRQRERIGRVAVVGRPGPMISVVSTFRYLVPWLRVAAFHDRVPAIEFLHVPANDA